MSGFMNPYSKYHSPNRRKPVKYGRSLTYLVPRRHRSKLASGNNQTVPEFPREEQQEELIKLLQEERIKLQEGRIKQKQLEKLIIQKEKLIKQKEISGWTLLVTNLILEIASAVFDQMGYALIGMVLAFVALLLAPVELIRMARKERIIWAGKRPILPLHTSATRKPVGTIVEYFGLASAVWQCVYSTVEYIYTPQGKDNPIKMYLQPLIFLFCVVIPKLLVDKRSIDKSS